MQPACGAAGAPSASEQQTHARWAAATAREARGRHKTMQRPRRFARIIVVYVASLVITVAMLVWWIIAVLPYHLSLIHI